MNHLTSLENYTASQKIVGLRFIYLGVGLFVLGGIAYFISLDETLTDGIVVSSIVGGLLILVGGIGYFNFSKKTHQTQAALYQKDRQAFVKVEQARMAQVVKDYPKYQVFFATFIVVGLVVVLLVPSTFWKGAAIPIIILFGVVMVIEMVSHKAILIHYENVS